MAKRFTDTDIWKTQRWFRKLSPLDKLAFCYIKDQCNHAGVWKIDCTDLVEDLNLDEFDLPKFVVAINTEYDKITGKKIIKERLRIVNKNFLWITGFVQFQYENRAGKVNADAAPVRTALQFLEGLGTLTEGLDKGYIVLGQPLHKSSVRPKDKDKDKDKDKEDKKIGVKGEEKTEPSTSEKKKYTSQSEKKNDTLRDEKKIAGEPLPPFRNFSEKPTAEDFAGLPEVRIGKTIERVAISTNITLDADAVKKMWEIFKVQNLTGEAYYGSENKVFLHFENWITKQKFKKYDTNPTALGHVGKTIKFDPL